MYENLQTYGEMEDPFGLSDGGGAGFMTAEAEDFGLGETEEYGGDGEAFTDGFDQFGDQFGDQYAWEGEGFDQFGDLEGEEFFGKIWKAAKKAAKVVAPLAKKFAPQIGTFAKNLESEDEGETEDELNAPVRVPSTDDQLSESMAVAATKSNPIDASALGSALTVTIASRAPLPVKAVVPVLAKAGSDFARKLAASNDPRAKALIRTLPTIQKKTVATLTKKVQNGKPVTPRTAVRVMARHASRTMSNPQVIAKALADNAAKKRSLDRKAIAGAERFY